MFESELFIPENRSQWPGGATKYKPPLHSGFGLSVGGLLDETMTHIYRLSIVFLNVTKHLKLALFIEKYNSLSKKQ